MSEAHQKGIDYVQVQLVNDTDQIIPQRLEADLLNFDTYGLNDFWTQYHAQVRDGQQYDYQMDIRFENIAISPERVREKEIIREKEIEDGFTYARNSRGQIQKDSLGKKIRIPILKKVRCTLYQFTQFKEAKVGAQISYHDLSNNQIIRSYPLQSGFVFEHAYATFEGDRKALESKLFNLTRAREIVFPTNEEMIYDAGEDLKTRLKSIIIKHRF